MENYPTIIDIARRSGDPKIRPVIEVLEQTNSALTDIAFVECNMGTTHLTTVRTGIPVPEWRTLNRGVGKGKSTTKQLKVGTGMLEQYAEIDKKQVVLAKRLGAQDAAPDFLASENAAFIQGFGQESARVMFYGDPSHPEQPIGLTYYYNSKAGESQENIIDAGGTGAGNTSIWLIGWGVNTIHGLYPQGSVGGLQEQHLGEHTVTDENGKQFQALRTLYQWDQGYVVRDWRYGVRICNIDFNALVNNPTDVAAAKIIELLTRAVYKLPTYPQERKDIRESIRPAIYCRKEILTALDLQVQNKSNLILTYQDIDGRPVLTFRGIPIRIHDQLLATEARVV